eukprot:Partr_v1_DN28064_c2_g2_i1_m57229 putative Ribosomal protein
MLPYIYGRRAGIHVINLEYSFVHLRRACNVTREICKRGGSVLFLGKRPFMKKICSDAAYSSGQFFVHGPWLKGCLSDHENTLRNASPDGVFSQPSLIVVLDINEMKDALEEAAITNVPTIGLVDTDCDPLLVTYPIPGNDDSHSAVEIVASSLA